MKKQPKRTLVVEFMDGTSKSIPITQAVCLDIPKMGLWFEETKNKSFKIVWTTALASNMSEIKCLKIDRE